MVNNVLILPYKAKIYGVLLIVLSIIFAFSYFSGYKPDFTYIKVFTIFSIYLEKKSFTIIETNILDELAVVFLVVGILLIIFSREIKELPIFNNFRLVAMFYSIISTSTLWILSYLLVYGLPIFILSSTVFIIFLITYYSLFRYFIFKNHYN